MISVILYNISFLWDSLYRFFTAAFYSCDTQTFSLLHFHSLKMPISTTTKIYLLFHFIPISCSCCHLWACHEITLNSINKNFFWKVSVLPIRAMLLPRKRPLERTSHDLEASQPSYAKRARGVSPQLGLWDELTSKINFLFGFSPTSQVHGLHTCIRLLGLP